MHSCWPLHTVSSALFVFSLSFSPSSLLPRAPTSRQAGIFFFPHFLRLFDLDSLCFTEDPHRQTPKDKERSKSSALLRSTILIFNRGACAWRKQVWKIQCDQKRKRQGNVKCTEKYSKFHPSRNISELGLLIFSCIGCFNAYPLEVYLRVNPNHDSVTAHMFHSVSLLLSVFLQRSSLGSGIVLLVVWIQSCPLYMSGRQINLILPFHSFFFNVANKQWVACTNIRSDCRLNLMSLIYLRLMFISWGLFKKKHINLDLQR